MTELKQFRTAISALNKTKFTEKGNLKELLCTEEKKNSLSHESVVKNKLSSGKGAKWSCII